MSAPPISAARRTGIDELAEFIAGAHSTGARVEPERILKAKGITLSFGSYGPSFDGMLEHRKGRFHVYCNLDRVEARDSPRARFTVAHELGHYFIDEHRNALASGRVPQHPSRCEFESRNPAEVEADVFAAGLLLPRRRFVEAVSRAGRGLEAVKTLAGTFGTSLTSTGVRFVECTPGYSAVIKWNEDGIAWHWISADMWVAGYRGLECERSTLPPDSATADALGAPGEESGVVFERGSTASLWFPHISAGSPKNCVLVEHAIPLGRFGVLTLLTADPRAF